MDIDSFASKYTAYSSIFAGNIHLAASYYLHDIGVVSTVTQKFIRDWCHDCPSKC